jgi:dUTP pyrophosphatase
VTYNHKLLVKLLDHGAKIPTIANKGDLGYDVYALEDVLVPGITEYDNSAVKVAVIRTGIAVSSYLWDYDIGSQQIAKEELGLIVKDRSSMALKGVFTHGGVIDSGYRGELKIIITSLTTYSVKKGDKIAQIVPVRVYTGTTKQVEEFDSTERGEFGFGSSGS